MFWVETLNISETLLFFNRRCKFEDATKTLLDSKEFLAKICFNFSCLYRWNHLSLRTKVSTLSDAISYNKIVNLKKMIFFAKNVSALGWFCVIRIIWLKYFIRHRKKPEFDMVEVTKVVSRILNFRNRLFKLIIKCP